MFAKMLARVTGRSQPFWTVGNPLADPFGGPVLGPVTPLQVAEILAGAGKSNLIEWTSAHDDDVLPGWNPGKAIGLTDEEKDQLAQIKATLQAGKVGFHMITCNLHSDPLFRNGGLTNPDRQIRVWANQKACRAALIGNELGATVQTYWVARDGFEVAVKVPWREVWQWMADGCNGARSFCKERGLTIVKHTIEPKPNEPRGHMYIPTAGHAVGFILRWLKEPEVWGVNPELMQHEGMTLIDAVNTVGFLASAGMLSFLHFGNQIKGQFDNDFPPLVGPEHLKETVLMMWVLGQLNWAGIVEYDCHMLRAEADPEQPIRSRMEFVENCAFALALTEELTARIEAVDPSGVSPHLASRIDLTTTAAMCNVPIEEIVARAHTRIAKA